MGTDVHCASYQLPLRTDRHTQRSSTNGCEVMRFFGPELIIDINVELSIKTRFAEISSRCTILYNIILTQSTHAEMVQSNTVVNRMVVRWVAMTVCKTDANEKYYRGYAITTSNNVSIPIYIYIYI